MNIRIMFERFTDRARKVMALANQEAQRFGHEFIGTEHILLGLVKEGSGVGAVALKNLGVDLRRVRLEVERLVQSGADVTTGKLQQTPRVKKVIEYAIEEARGLGHEYVGTEHLLLGLLRESAGLAAQVLTNFGVQLDRARGEVLNLVGAGASDPDERDTQAPVMTGGQGVERFTDRARLVMQMAEQEGLNHEYIGTEHILLGLVKEGSGVGANALKNLNVDLRKVRLEVEKLVRAGPDMITVGKLPRTARAKKVIDYAIEEARNLNHNYIGTEHLLLGLLREEDGVAALVLVNMGVELKAVREEVLHLLGAGDELPPVTEAGPQGSERPSGLLESEHGGESFARLLEALQGWLDRHGAKIREAIEMKDECVKQAAYEKAAEFRDLANALKRQFDVALEQLTAYIESLEKRE